MRVAFCVNNRAYNQGCKLFDIDPNIDALDKIRCEIVPSEVELREVSASAPFHSSLFTSSIFRRSSPVDYPLEARGVIFEVPLPMVEPHQSVVMVGSSPLLGEWRISDGVVMGDGSHPLWRTPSLEIGPEELLSIEYKFVVVDSLTREVVAWEQGANRCVDCSIDQSADTIYFIEREPIFDIEAWRGAGVAIPLFSLRSERSMGVGDFADLKLMVDWAVKTHQRIIQILPINDTTMSGGWQDSYPYNANSIFALHPQYISLRDVGNLKDSALQAELEARGAELNALPMVDYEAMSELKSRYLRAIYADRGASTLKESAFKEFFDSNRYWLESYALFSLLRDKYSTAEFSQWGGESLYCEELLTKYQTTSPKELGYYYFVQYHLHIQLLEAGRYARQRGVAFKGDIPIGVSRMSVDVWVNPRLFRLDAQAGAPPDDFSVLGQNWGFPTYNWEEMALDGYAWWQARFSKMAEYFDAYRIDHILGFFRIWEIPLDAIHGLLGHFSPALPYSAEQMEELYGFTFDESYTRPDINRWIVDHLFAERSTEVIERFLEPTQVGHYRLKAEYNTQLKLSMEVDDKELLEGLLQLLTEVLFVEDPYIEGRYHPRISAQSTYKYRAMSSGDKALYDTLYNDFYYRRHNDYWRDEAMRKLPALISATNMLTCGEDLGMIPDCVPEVMEHEQILSLEIERMPKDPALQFGAVESYPYRSVCTTSTHDMNPIRAWLLEDRALSNRYFSEILGVDATIDEDCPAWICHKIIERHLLSPAMWSILPLQDWLSISEEHRNVDPNSERINIPANSRHHWRYRMHCTIEELLGADSLNKQIISLVELRGR